MASPPPPSASQHACAVCGEGGRAKLNYGTRTCASCREFFRRRNGADLGPCKREGNCPINQHTRGACPPCRPQKCRAIGMRPHAQAAPILSQHPTDQQETNRTEAHNDALARHITSKCADGHTRGAFRLLTTFDTVAQPDAGAIEELRAKDPTASPDEDLQH
ncbi:protein ultraspiracle homolog [Eriocheir sinensis]|uniref:protein ultraspiracle homolog n=1 Tax=Eriocheir sinensis TaxID=95602 RepID=UPI0021C5B469|nr:protein ultraspiracle homolog [Eriocheir sinensis]